MNAPTPNHDDHSDLRDVLRRDAARIEEPPFDAALHRATMRHIRALSDAGRTRSWLRLKPMVAACVALLLIVVFFTRREPSRVRPDGAAAIASTQNTIARLSVEPESSLPAWMSPTASLLDPPRFAQ